MDTTANHGSLTSLTTELEALYDVGLYRQAHDLGIAKLGNPDEWALPELRIMATRILGHLGLTRPSDCLLYRLWRLSNHF